jgi:hypothetical protein
VALELLGYIDLPAHKGEGGFDHAAVHTATGRCYVAHTANDAVDVIDLVSRKHVNSIGGLPAVAGALVDEASGLVFTSNRGENTVGIFRIGSEDAVEKVRVGLRPNGLAYDPGRRRLLAAHVGDVAVEGSRTVSLIDVATRTHTIDVPVPGRTRWTVFDPEADAFHVNIAEPAQIVVVDAADPVKIRRVVDVPHSGPHGLDLDIRARKNTAAGNGLDETPEAVAVVKFRKTQSELMAARAELYRKHPAMAEFYRRLPPTSRRCSNPNH